MSEAEFLKSVGAKVRQLRKSKRITGKVMAKLADKSKSPLYELEAGKVNCQILTLYKIANALEVDIKEFF
ncbi:MAG: helix-turn-helix domain-containing protein [Bacteroidota bacterium]